MRNFKAYLFMLLATLAMIAASCEKDDDILELCGECFTYEERYSEPLEMYTPGEISDIFTDCSTEALNKTEVIGTDENGREIRRVTICEIYD